MQRHELFRRQDAAKVNLPAALGDEGEVPARIEEEARHLLADERGETALDVDEGSEQRGIDRLGANLRVAAGRSLDVDQRSCGRSRSQDHRLAREEEVFLGGGGMI